VGAGHELVDVVDAGGARGRALALQSRTGPVYALIEGSESWGDVRIEGRVLFPDSSDNYLGFIYRYVDDGRRIDFGSLYIKGNGSYVQANPRYDTNVGRTVYPERRAALTGDHAVTIGAWQRFALEVVGGEAHLYVGAMDRPVMALPFGAPPRGAFGFEPRNPGGPVWIDDVSVRTIPRFSNPAVRDSAPSYRPHERLTDWQSLGPLTSHAAALERDGFPLGATVEDDGRTLAWEPFETDTRGAVVTGRLTEFRGARRVAYFRTSLRADAPGPATLELATADALALWLNGDFVGFAPAQAAVWWDAGDNEDHRPIRARLELRQGANDLVVRALGGTYASGGFFAALRRR
jgi:hypothetical protein